MKLKLPADIASRQALQAVILEIRGYGRWASQASVKKQVAGQEFGESPAVSPASAALVESWHGDQPITQKSLDELVTALERLLVRAPYASVVLAAPAPAKLKTEIVSWFRANVNSEMLVDFSFNSTMLGGMVVSIGSHTYDWSFKRKILAERHKFPEVLRSV